jgi:hypothetical protein
MQNLQNMLNNVLAEHVAHHQTCGKDWPADARYALVYRLRTWPVGEDREDTVTFLADANELRAKVKELDHWAQLEDNGWRLVDLFMWDLGPERITHDFYLHAHDAPRLD